MKKVNNEKIVFALLAAGLLSLLWFTPGLALKIIITIIVVVVFVILMMMN